ncbi:DoxX family protein [Streptomyces sp. NPDC089424]|uniref:DoxX family protein n=1 Tax=Streptomyces sp. NPDC089424 TaxID=3365917 RepID=UPI00381C544B
MYIAAVILSALLALFSLAAGAPKAQLKGSVPDGLVAKGLSSGLIRIIGLAEVAAAVGLVVGIWWQPLGIAAAIGVAVVMIGAVRYHAKWGDYADNEARGAATAPIIFTLVALATALTLAASQ